MRNRESGHSQPDLRYIPSIIAFLGYNPLPEAKTLAQRLVRHRTTLGMSQKEAARQIGVDQGTLARWERGEREPAASFLRRVERFLDEEEVAGLGVRPWTQRFRSCR